METADLALRGTHIHMTGIKGTGMAALAEILTDEGVLISGSDVAERFFTDDILDRLGVSRVVGFAAEHVPVDTTTLVYSAAYGDDNPERVEARRRGIPQYSYTEMLGRLSRVRPSLAVSGIHGKTTISAMIGTMVRGIDYPATVLVGSAVPTFGGSATWRGGGDAFIAETCEYRRHFLAFSPAVLLISNVEAEHLDYFSDEIDVENAFVEFARQLPEGAPLVYCHDDPGARRTVDRIVAERPDLRSVPYGESAPGPWRYEYRGVADGFQRFVLAGQTGPVDRADRVDRAGGARPGTAPREWRLPIPGRHMVENAVGALAALHAIMTVATPDRALDADRCAAALETYRGTRRRSEILGEPGGVLVIDDYAHHPRAIRATIEGYRDFYRGRRIVLDFMSHTYTRSRLLLDEFVAAFDAADILILNDIYASAREARDESFDGAAFYRAIAAHRETIFEPDFERAADLALSLLKPGDLFVTMGAGDNFRIAQEAVRRLEDRHA